MHSIDSTATRKTYSLPSPLVSLSNLEQANLQVWMVRLERCTDCVDSLLKNPHNQNHCSSKMKSTFVVERPAKFPPAVCLHALLSLLNSWWVESPRCCASELPRTKASTARCNLIAYWTEWAHNKSRSQVQHPTYYQYQVLHPCAS